MTNRKSDPDSLETNRVTEVPFKKSFTSENLASTLNNKAPPAQQPAKDSGSSGNSGQSKSK